MVSSNTNSKAEESFMRRFIYRASIKKEDSNESPVIEPRRKMHILCAINIYRFKGFRDKCTKLSTKALNFLNKEILVRSEMCEQDITIPSTLLEDRTFLNEFKNDIITKKCQNWDLKIKTVINEDDHHLSREIKICGIELEKSNLDSLRKQKSVIEFNDNNEMKKQTFDSIKSKTPYVARLNDEIYDFKNNIEEGDSSTSEWNHIMDTPKQKSFNSRTNSLTHNTIKTSRKRLTNYMPGIHKAFENISKNIALRKRKSIIDNKLNNACLIDHSPRYKQPTIVPVLCDNVNKNIRKIEKPKRKKPNLESTRKLSPVDSMKKKTSPFSIPSSISTITPVADPTKLDFGEKNEDKYSYGSSEIAESSLPVVMQKFIDNGFNDQLPNDLYVACDNTSNDVNNWMNLYEDNLLSKNIDDSEATSARDMMNLRLLASEPSHRNFDRKSKFFRSFTQGINKKFQQRKNSEERQINDQILTNNKDKIKELLHRLEVQQTLIHQASKALNLCNLTKTFQHSIQHVESERLLLLSILKKKAVLNEIKRINEFQENSISLYEHGKVTISQICLSIDKDMIEYSGLTPDMCGWFMVTVTHESTVWATSAMNYSFDSPTTIRFPESITVPNLSPNFVINVDVYSLQLRNINCNDKEEVNCNNNITCPSPNNLWKKLEKSRLRQNEIQCSSIRDTSFQLTGYVQLTLQDIHRVHPWHLSSVPSNSILQGKIDFKLFRKIKISVIHSGFLTHGDEAGGLAVWNRLWCVLDGSCLKFWNYPQEDDLRSPLLIIDLTRCITNEVQVVDRTICARPRTLMFKTMRERVSRDENSMFLECQCTYTVVKHLLSCDTINDMMEWSTKLNYVLSVLSNWKSRRNDFIPTTEL